MDKLVAPINILLSVLVIALLALIASDLATFRLGRLFPGTVAGKSRPAPAIAAPTEDLASYGVILDKGLFGPATRGKLTPIVAAQPQQKTAATVSQGDLVLLGTAIGSFRETFALIQRTSTKEERVFRLGDSVFDLGPLLTVKKESAAIKAGGQIITLTTPTAGGTVPGSQPPPAAGQPGPGGALAAQVGAGSYVIDQRALNAALDNIGQAMTDARLLPSSKDGKVEGFRVSEVKPQGIFGTVGIRNGDVLLRINDFPIDSPEKAIQSFASLKGQNRIKLDLIRDGQPTTFTYDIR
jgi:general secretion pathway protein C